MSQLDTTAPEPPLWRRVWSSPEPEISTAAFGGELLVAGVRLLVVAILLYFPIDAGLQAWGLNERLALPTTAAVGLVLALFLYSARRWGRSWIGFVSSILDVSLVSALLAVFLALGRPEEATNNLGLFPIYFLAIAATSLRYDARICIVTGTLALLQYAAVIAYVDWRWHLHAAAFAPLAELAGATFIAATIVVRSRELRLLSTRDRFTGLLNRAVFNEQLEREVAFARREDTRFAVAMLDIDHFKKFNDTYGHAGGDEALRAVARTLRDSCRSTDMVARYGGEEFALDPPRGDERPGDRPAGAFPPRGGGEGDRAAGPLEARERDGEHRRRHLAGRRRDPRRPPPLRRRAPLSGEGRGARPGHRPHPPPLPAARRGAPRGFHGRGAAAGGADGAAGVGKNKDPKDCKDNKDQRPRKSLSSLQSLQSFRSLCPLPSPSWICASACRTRSSRSPWLLLRMKSTYSRAERRVIRRWR